MALILGVLLAAAGFYFPVGPLRIPHDSRWKNPAMMGAMVTEMGHTALCYFMRILPHILLTVIMCVHTCSIIAFSRRASCILDVL